MLLECCKRQALLQYKVAKEVARVDTAIAWLVSNPIKCIQELGTLAVRGYAYQEAYPLTGINLFPGVRTLRHLSASFNEILQNAQVSFCSYLDPRYTSG